jgi:hypothetical protein
MKDTNETTYSTTCRHTNLGTGYFKLTDLDYGVQSYLTSELRMILFISLRVANTFLGTCSQCSIFL